MTAQGNEGLVAIIDSLPSILQVQGETEELNVVLVAVLEAQARKDHLFIADLLDNALLALLVPQPLSSISPSCGDQG